MERHYASILLNLRPYTHEYGPRNILLTQMSWTRGEAPVVKASGPAVGMATTYQHDMKSRMGNSWVGLIMVFPRKALDLS